MNYTNNLLGLIILATNWVNFIELFFLGGVGGGGGGLIIIYWVRFRWVKKVINPNRPNPTQLINPWKQKQISGVGLGWIGSVVRCIDAHSYKH